MHFLILDNTKMLITEIEHKYGLVFNEKLKKYSDIIVPLFANDIIPQTTTDENVLYLIGLYHETTSKNFNLMKEHYLMAIKKNSDDAMYRLGKYYSNVEINYDYMKKYYLMAIDVNKVHLKNMTLSRVYEHSMHIMDILILYKPIGYEKSLAEFMKKSHGIMSDTVIYEHILTLNRIFDAYVNALHLKLSSST